MSEASVTKLKLLAAKIRASNTIEDDTSLKLVKEDEKPKEAKQMSQDDQETKNVTDSQGSTETSYQSSDTTKKKKVSFKFNFLMIWPNYFVHFQGKGLFGLFKKKSKGEKTPSEAGTSEVESSRTQTEQTPIREPSMQSSQEEDLSKVVVKIDPVVHELKSAQVTKANDKIVTQIALWQLKNWISLQNVTELYRIAERIVGSNIENILSKEKSDEGEE